MNLSKSNYLKTMTLGSTTTYSLSRLSLKLQISTRVRPLATISKIPTPPLHRTHNFNPIPFNRTSTPLPEPPTLPAYLKLKTGDSFKATSFGAPLLGASVSGEVVFTTSLVGYPESMTDPSYRGQILVFTQPLIGNYGVPDSNERDSFGLLRHFEAEGIQVCRSTSHPNFILHFFFNYYYHHYYYYWLLLYQVKGIIVSNYATKYSHWEAVESLGQWCARQGIPALSGVDTRALVTLLRERGSTLGEIVIGENEHASTMSSSLNNEKQQRIIEDPNASNLCAQVSVKEKVIYNPSGDVNIALIGKIHIKKKKKKRFKSQHTPSMQSTLLHLIILFIY